MGAGERSFQLWGSDSLAPIAQRVAEWYMLDRPDRTVTVVTNTTGRGIKAVLDGTAHAAMASSSIPDDATRRAAKQGRALTSWPVAHDAIVPVVHPSNPLADLGLAQLRAIYTGETTRWQGLGGPDGPIRAFAPEPSSGTAAAWRQMVIGPRAIQSPRVSVVETEAMAKAVARDPLAIGFLAGLAPDRGNKVLTVDAIGATSKTLRDGVYPLGRALSIVTFDPPPPQVADFIHWFRTPDKGQLLVAGMGAAPIVGDREFGP